MNINNLCKTAYLFFKLASFDDAKELLASGTIADAAQILGISPSANESEASLIIYSVRICK